jgi:hypothetical protein
MEKKWKHKTQFMLTVDSSTCINTLISLSSNRVSKLRCRDKAEIIYTAWLELFSAAWIVAVENEVIFGGLGGLPKIVSYFCQPIYGRRKLEGKTTEN